MIKSSSGVFLLAMGIMISILWIRSGLHWGWVAGIWVVCSILNRLYYLEIENGKKRKTRVFDLTRITMNKGGVNVKPSEGRPSTPPAGMGLRGEKK